MFTRDNPYRLTFWIILVLLIALLLLVRPVQSQTPALTQVARSLDGQISARLPEGWVSRAAAGFRDRAIPSKRRRSPSPIRRWWGITR
ncbi:MAG: hypothetical protein L6Q98_11415 [Anaerolineae bacterium]|nr:hypothetical protein [Anaerolineae bacterium]NUQ05561.1 hypothetical protein [Anaerolineae bacterium]